MARRNRFERVDEVQPDAITLELAPQGNHEVAKVHVPAEVAPGRLDEDQTSPDLPKKEAFRSAVKLANDLKAAIVVMDLADQWDEEWGDLYRPV